MRNQENSIIRQLSILISLLSLLFAMNAHAAEGTHTGGGGGSAVCFDSKETLAKVRAQGGRLGDDDVKKIKSIETYDLYVARKAGRALIDLLPQEQGKEQLQAGYAAYYERIARRFENTVPAITDLLAAGKANREEAESHGRVFRGDGVAHVDDAYELEVPDVSKCAIVTTAIQKYVGGRVEIHFDMRLLAHKLNSELSRAVLNMHENLYTLISSTLRDSTSVRTLIGLALMVQVPETAASLNRFVVALDFHGFLDAEDGRGAQYGLGFLPPSYLGLAKERQAHRIVTDLLSAVMSATREWNKTYGTRDVDRSVSPVSAQRHAFMRDQLRALWKARAEDLRRDPNLDARVVNLLDPILSKVDADSDNRALNCQFDPRGLVFPAIGKGYLREYFFKDLTSYSYHSFNPTAEELADLALSILWSADLLTYSHAPSQPMGALERLADGPATED